MLEKLLDRLCYTFCSKLPFGVRFETKSPDDFVLLELPELVGSPYDIRIDRHKHHVRDRKNHYRYIEHRAKRHEHVPEPLVDVRKINERDRNRDQNSRYPFRKTRHILIRRLPASA